MSAILHILATLRPGAVFEFDIDQTSVSGFCSSFGGSCTATSTTASTTTVGGVPTVTYLWTYVSGDSFTINSPTGSSTTFSKTNPVAGEPDFSGVYKCTATDDDSNVLNDTVIVNLSFSDLQ